MNKDSVDFRDFSRGVPSIKDPDVLDTLDVFTGS